MFPRVRRGARNAGSEFPAQFGEDRVSLCGEAGLEGVVHAHAEIILPAFNGLGSKTADVELSFDWCWQLTGKMKPDIMTITVELQGTGTLEQSVFESSQPTEGDLSNFAWQNVKVAIKGIDAGTRIIIRPTNADPSISSTRDQNRWYLDNIKVTAR